jgi:hypothetical protein
MKFTQMCTWNISTMSSFILESRSTIIINEQLSWITCEIENIFVCQIWHDKCQTYPILVKNLNNVSKIERGDG